MTNQRILRIAVPSIISNITVPLLGLVDVTIVGHLGAASYIGAIAVGGMLFSMIYWIFGFLARSDPSADAVTQHQSAPGFPVTRTAISDPRRRLSADRCQSGSPHTGHPLFSYLHLGRTCHTGTLQLYRLVYRHAEFPISYVHSHYTERGEHRRQPFLRICSRHEGRRSGTGHPDSSICRSADGLPALAALLPVIAQVCSINPTII